MIKQQDHSPSYPSDIALGSRSSSSLSAPKPLSEIEVSQLGSVVRNAAETIDAHVVIEIVGDYRRDLPFCCSVAVLITSPYGTVGLLQRLVSKLIEWRFLVPSISSSIPHSEPSADLPASLNDFGTLLINIPPDEDHSEILPEDHFDGFCRFKPSSASPIRELHLMVCSPQNWSYSLLYHTGPALFYEKLQAYALDLDISLTPEGLERLDGQHQKAVTSESEIFILLKLPYLPPFRRFDSVIFPSRPVKSQLSSVELETDPS